MVKIRLMRAGAKSRPYYRLIAIDERAPRDGRKLEELGTYDPIAKGPQIKLNGDKITKWVSRGAQMSPAAKALIKRGKKLEATLLAAAAASQATA
ncbi:MAG TPA: 30S ribosomal protein S16 [Myxococcota bacterium]|nr:30S ribosomal protein S16 [Myxococcota bacterium]